MPAKRYVVDLTPEERSQLEALIQKGKASARSIRRAHTLLLAADGLADHAIAQALHIGHATIERTRQRFVFEGLAAALTEKPRPGGERKLDGKQEAFLVALACSAPPQGRAKWSMQLLADRMVSLGMVETLSDETVRRRLKETNCNHGGKNAGASPK
jgi:transposase